jgi:hypothetical protein
MREVGRVSNGIDNSTGDRGLLRDFGCLGVGDRHDDTSRKMFRLKDEVQDPRPSCEPPHFGLTRVADRAGREFTADRRISGSK